MLEEFWKEKKHLLQIIAIVVAIGALFLTISLPENEKAKSALMNVQLAWLVIITFALFVLFINLLILAFRFEDKINKKKDVNFDDAIAYPVMFLGVWVLLNLWIYIINLYKYSVKEFMDWSLWPVGIFITAFGYYLSRKIFVTKKTKFFSIVRHSVYIFFCSSLLSLWVEMADLNFSLRSFVERMLVFALVFSAIIFLVDIYKIVKEKRKKKKV